MLVMVLAGATLICCAAWVAQKGDVAHLLSLDLNGVHATATGARIANPDTAASFCNSSLRVLFIAAQFYTQRPLVGRARRGEPRAVRSFYSDRADRSACFARSCDGV